MRWSALLSVVVLCVACGTPETNPPGGGGGGGTGGGTGGGSGGAGGSDGGEDAGHSDGGATDGGAVDSGYPQAQAAQYVALTDAGTAVCNDGTVAGYYFRRGAESHATKWFVHLAGGGMCNDAPTCAERVTDTPDLVTGGGRPATRTNFDGLLSPDCAINPEFCRWNLVQIPYCSSDVWSGQRAPQVGGGFDAGAPATWAFRGFQIVTAVLRDAAAGPLGSSHRLSAGGELLFSGSSAGGIGSFAISPRIGALVPSSITTRFLFDAAWLVDHPSFDGGTSTFREFQKGFELWNGQVSPDCLAAHAGDGGRCYLGKWARSYVPDPYFVQQFQRDNVFMVLLGLRPNAPGAAAWVSSWQAQTKSELTNLAPATFSALGYSTAGVPTHGTAIGPAWRGLTAALQPHTDLTIPHGGAERPVQQIFTAWYLDAGVLPHKLIE